MENKNEYIDFLMKIREEVPLSWCEIAKELEMPYASILRMVNEDNKSPLRALTIRKIKTLMNKYKQ